MQGSLADGQLAATATAMYTADGSTTVLAVVLENTSGSASETVVLTLTRSGSSARRIVRAVLAANEQLIVQGLNVSPGDILKGSATDATTVDYTVFSSTGEFRLTSLDASGAQKQVNTGVSGNQSITGRLLATLLAAGPKPTDTFAAAMTIDVTKTLHIIAASNTTSATVALTPSAAGSAGDLLVIVTEADSSGTVTATFASTFHSSGTQATTASTFSTAIFVSDGTRWLEVCRSTALT